MTKRSQREKKQNKKDVLTTISAKVEAKENDGPLLLFKHGLLGTKSGPVKIKDATITKHHKRASGKDKVLTQYHLNDATYLRGEIDTLLKECDGVYVIDTNTKDITNGQKVSICCFTHFSKYQDFLPSHYQCAPISWFQVQSDAEHPEKIAITKLIHILELNVKYMIGRKFAIITDHDLGGHDDYNNQKKEFLPGYFLPDYITLMYASADQGQDVVNKVIKCCDKEASSIINRLIWG